MSARAIDAVRRRWGQASRRSRTLLMLMFWIVVWQATLAGMRLFDDPALSSRAVTLLSGETTELAALADGNPLVVNLWASWCPPCRHEMPLLAAAQQREASIRFVFANQGERRASVEAYLTQSGIALRNVTLDPYAELGRLAGSSALPATLFYDAEGRLVDRHLGALSAQALERYLARLRTP